MGLEERFAALTIFSMNSKLPLALVLASLAQGPAFAAAPEVDPDWPCIQIKVPELSVAAVWAGPPVEAALENWRADTEVADLVAQLAQRRMPIEEATKEVAEFAAGLDEAERAERLTRLFAGLFQTLDHERGDVMLGIDRYGRKQKQLAEQVRQMARANQDAVSANVSVEANDRLIWATRIFNERRASLTFVCEIPTIIEQRLFALARAIQNELPK